MHCYFCNGPLQPVTQHDASRCRDEFEEHLGDGSIVRLGYERRHPGGQHVGSARCLVVIERDGHQLVLTSGFTSMHRTRKELGLCVDWREVPMAIQASDWLVVRD